MLLPQEYQPQFLGWRQTLTHIENFNENDRSGHVAFFVQFLTGLEQRLNWELPLVGGFIDAPEVASALVSRLRELAERPLELPRVEAAERALQSFSQLQEMRPQFSDIPVVNELLTLGAQDELKDTLPVRQRLPLLLAWITERETEWKAFGLLNPGRSSLVEKALYALQAVKGGAGAVHLYLEGEDADDLRQGMQLIVDTLKALAPAEETRFLVESQQADKALDLRLDRCSKLARQLGNLPADYHPLVAQSLSERERELADLRSWSFVTKTDHPVLLELDQELRALAQEFKPTLGGESSQAIVAYLDRAELLRLGLERARSAPAQQLDFQHAEEVQIS